MKELEELSISELKEVIGKCENLIREKIKTVTLPENATYEEVIKKCLELISVVPENIYDWFDEEFELIEGHFERYQTITYEEIINNEYLDEYNTGEVDEEENCGLALAKSIFESLKSGVTGFKYDW